VASGALATEEAPTAFVDTIASAAFAQLGDPRRQSYALSPRQRASGAIPISRNADPQPVGTRDALDVIAVRGGTDRVLATCGHGEPGASRGACPVRRAERGNGLSTSSAPRPAPTPLPTRPSGDKEGVLVAWGYTTQGKRVLVSVRLGQRERHEDWLDLGRDLTRRGLRAPWLVVSDGAPGLVKAINELWPEADRQRCTVHRLRNILAKLPKRPELHERVKGAYWAALDEALDPDDAERRLREVVTNLEHEYPSAAACLAEDLPALCVHLKYLPRQRKRFRSSNLLERSLEEVRRRTKVIGRFPGETSCLSLCWAVLDIFIAGARGLGLSDLEYRQVVQLKVALAQREEFVAQKTA
jgi:Transposase, Mutator family